MNRCLTHCESFVDSQIRSSMAESLSFRRWIGSKSEKFARLSMITTFSRQSESHWIGWSFVPIEPTRLRFAKNGALLTWSTIGLRLWWACLWRCVPWYSWLQISTIWRGLHRNFGRWLSFETGSISRNISSNKFSFHWLTSFPRARRDAHFLIPQFFLCACIECGIMCIKPNCPYAIK